MADYFSETQNLGVIAIQQHDYLHYTAYFVFSETKSNSMFILMVNS